MEGLNENSYNYPFTVKCNQDIVINAMTTQIRVHTKWPAVTKIKSTDSSHSKASIQISTTKEIQRERARNDDDVPFPKNSYKN